MTVAGHQARRAALDDSRGMRRESFSFTLASLLRITAWMAVMFAVLRWLGPRYWWAVFLVAQAFAPTIAALIVLRLSAQPAAIRYGVAALTLVFFAAITIGLCGLFYGAQSVPLALLGMLIEWPGQAGILMCLHISRGRPASTSDELARVSTIEAS